MKHLLFGDEANTYDVALLCKSSAMNKTALVDHYVAPLAGQGVNSLIAFSLEYDGKNLSAAYAKEYLGRLMPVLKELQVKYLLCTDGAYFKLLAKVTKSDPHHGYVLPCKWEGCEDMQVILSLNHQQLIYNPTLQEKLDQSLMALVSHATGGYVSPGTGIIHKAVYPTSLSETKLVLSQLMEYPELTCDIETFSLRFWEAGIGTISFAIDEHRGVAFSVDYQANEVQPPLVEKRAEYGRYVPDHDKRALLRWFFENYTGKLIFHNAGFDAKVLIYVLWMKSLLDTAGLLEGLRVMTRSIDDTKIIAYLATNSTAGNVLGLKYLAQEFAGNWAVEEIKDIKLVPLPQLLQYNLVDALSTWFVHKKYWPVMVADRQLEIYQTLKLPTQKLILQIELTGMPMSRSKIVEVKARMEKLKDEQLEVISRCSALGPFEDFMTDRAWEKEWQDRKAKAKNPDKIFPKDRAQYPRHVFNPNSGPQLQILLYEPQFFGLPVLDLTDTKQPATGAETLEKLIHHTQDPSQKELLGALIKHGQVTKILSTFIAAFEQAISKDDSDTVWLHGSLNIGGTVSGRLSSSDPNLQNLPAGNGSDLFKAMLGKWVKECFCAPKGKVFAGADFNSLEDMISALTTKDSNKLKVYTDGYDGHCLRACYYFKDELIAEGINIDIADPKSVNSLKAMKHWSRNDSKPPTFLLTYMGTYHGMMSNLGWSKEKSQRIEANYHELYKESDAYVARRLMQASKDGYVEVAFGLRVRAPLLAQVVWGGPNVPYAAQAEGRTIGNALGQSYGQLNDRAAVEFMEKVWTSEYRYRIAVCNLIHDCIYLLMDNDPAVAEWANRELIKSMQWQELPEIQHPTVKLGAALDIFWPNWANAITLPNDADQATIKKVCREAREEYVKSKEK